MRKGSMMLLAALTVAAGLGCEKQNMGSTIEPVQILRRSSGDAMLKADPLEVVLVNSAEQLAAMGGDKLSDLTVDFGGESLLVLTLGEQATGGYWVRMTSVQKSGDRLFVQGTVNVPGEGAASTGVTHPYDAVVIPKTEASAVHPEMDNVVGQEPPAAAGG